MTKQESKEVTKTQGTEVAAPSLADWGSPETMDSRDIVIPKILCMQAMSELVTEGKAIPGDFVHSVSGEKLGRAQEQGVEIIPFIHKKVWFVFEDGKFARTEPYTQDNADRKWSENVDGIAVKNELSHTFYFLKVGETGMPFTINMKGTSSKTGRQLATQMNIINAQQSLPPAGVVMELNARKESNDKGTYFVLTVTPKRESTPEELSLAFQWFNTLKAKPQTAAPDSEQRGNYTNDDVPF